MMETDEQIMLCKEKILYDNLIHLSDNRKRLLKKKINSELLDEIIDYLSKKPFYTIIPLMSNYIDDVNEWFNE